MSSHPLTKQVGVRGGRDALAALGAAAIHGNILHVSAAAETCCCAEDALPYSWESAGAPERLRALPKDLNLTPCASAIGATVAG
jgi:hypothetical protein